MTHTRRTILYGAIGILTFDSAAATLSVQLGFAYAWGLPGSLLIYAAVGFIAARGSGLLAGVGSGAAVAGVDATIGWVVSWLIGPGYLPGASPDLVVIVIVEVVFLGALCGGIGALAARVFTTRHA